MSGVRAKWARVQAPSWLAPIMIWYESTMRGLSINAQRAREHAVHTGHWWRHLEQPGMAPYRPVVLTEHAKERVRERCGVDPSSLDLGAMRFVDPRRHGRAVSDGSVFLVVRREKACYRAVTALSVEAP